MLDEDIDFFSINLLGKAGKARDICKENGHISSLAGGLKAGLPEAFHQIGAHHNADLAR
ncbi:MAG TPA: hypothetical protein PK613_13570 [Anaerolineaceae bacterium]|nr:hypothetical protein [Anaerolineaceae bacterium]